MLVLYHGGLLALAGRVGETVAAAVAVAAAAAACLML